MNEHLPLTQSQRLQREVVRIAGMFCPLAWFPRPDGIGHLAHRENPLLALPFYLSLGHALQEAGMVPVQGLLPAMGTELADLTVLVQNVHWLDKLCRQAMEVCDNFADCWQ